MTLAEVSELMEKVRSEIALLKDRNSRYDEMLSGLGPPLADLLDGATTLGLCIGERLSGAAETLRMRLGGGLRLEALRLLGEAMAELESVIESAWGEIRLAVHESLGRNSGVDGEGAGEGEGEGGAGAGEGAGEVEGDADGEDIGVVVDMLDEELLSILREERLVELLSLVSARLGKYSALFNGLESELEATMDELSLIEGDIERSWREDLVLQGVIQMISYCIRKDQEILDLIAGRISRCLSEIFEQEYRVDLSLRLGEPERKRNAIIVEVGLSTDWSGSTTDIISRFGDGVCSLLGVLLQLHLVIGYGIPIMVLDEPMAHLQARRWKRALDLIVDIAVKNGVQLVIITHSGYTYGRAWLVRRELVPMNELSESADVPGGHVRHGRSGRSGRRGRRRNVVDGMGGAVTESVPKSVSQVLYLGDSGMDGVEYQAHEIYVESEKGPVVIEGFESSSEKLIVGDEKGKEEAKWKREEGREETESSGRSSK